MAYANILTLYLGQMSAVVLAWPKIFMPTVTKGAEWRWNGPSSVGIQNRANETEYGSGTIVNLTEAQH